MNLEHHPCFSEGAKHKYRKDPSARGAEMQHAMQLLQP